MRLAWKIAAAPWRWWCGFLLAVGMRATSSNERMLAQEVEVLTRDLHQRDHERIPTLEARVKVLEAENKELALVIVRNQMRVRAETAEYAEKVAQNVTG